MELVYPSAEYLQSYREAIAEYRASGESHYAFRDPDSYDIFEYFEKFRSGVGLKPGYVRATYLWLVDGGEFLGEISIRHSLTEQLLRYGGNIGYGVRRSRWRKGAGTRMLAMALDYARDELGMERALITCDDDNVGSARVIEKNGGVLWDRLENRVDGRPITTRRYWIDIKRRGECHEGTPF